MEPTLHEGDAVFTSMLPYMWGEPKIGDIVIIDINLPERFTYFHLFGQFVKRNPITELFFDEEDLQLDTCWVKRVVGVAGDEIRFEDGKFYHNGKLIDENYIKEQTVYTYPVDTTIVIPDGYVYVMGDNRNASKDSRDINVGPIPINKIVGKMWKSS